MPAGRWLADYVRTYVERDVRSVLRIGDLGTFRAFVELCAGRTGQELNLDRLGADAGIARATARSWLNVLEAGFLAFHLPAWSANARKRVIKAPKLHLADTGLACHLLGIASADQLRQHPLRGAIFETWVANEIRKARANRGIGTGLAHLREIRGAKVDLVVTDADRVRLVEAKSGATVAGDWLAPLQRLITQSEGGPAPEVYVIYGGDQQHRRRGVDVRPWSTIHDIAW